LVWKRTRSGTVNANVARWTADLDDGAECSSEVFARVVVDDRIDARVGIRQTIPDDAQSHVDVAVFRYVAEERHQKVDVNGQPENGEDKDKERTSTSGWTLRNTL